MKKILKKIKLLRCIYLWYRQKIQVPLILWFMCKLLRIKYRRQEKRVRAVYKKRPLKVLFPISNIAKWKMQSLFDLMQKSKHYTPIIAVTVSDVERFISNEDRLKTLSLVRSYCKRLHMPYVEAYDPKSEKNLSFKRFEPDIVWYQNPWDIDKVQSPECVANYALTCYVPYFVQNYGYLPMDCLQIFHRFLWRHFTLNERWAKLFMEEQDKTGGRVGAVVGCGHPMLDNFMGDVYEESKETLVIYAPHFSCGVAECYSTFLENGEKILQFAQAHPEIKWAFKPHPTLKSTLINVIKMNSEEVEAYYQAWESIGETCVGEYVELFKRSSALLTDCGSFLVEYACTGKPIIRLVSKNALFQPHPIVQALFDSYYNAHNWKDAQSYLQRVVLDKDDFKKEKRLELVAYMKLRGNHASTNILNSLNTIFKDTF